MSESSSETRTTSSSPPPKPGDLASASRIEAEEEAAGAVMLLALNYDEHAQVAENAGLPRVAQFRRVAAAHLRLMVEEYVNRKEGGA